MLRWMREPRFTRGVLDRPFISSFHPSLLSNVHNRISISENVESSNRVNLREDVTKQARAGGGSNMIDE